MINRRSFLHRAIATGAVAQLPFLGRPREAKAAPTFNAIFYYVPDGIVPSLWFPTGGETDFTLPPMADALTPIRDNVAFLRGISMYAGEPTHPGGTKKVLTATGPQSMDVVLGAKLKGSSPFDSLQLGVGSNFENGSGSVSFIGPAQELKPDDNPLNVFSRVFAGGAMGTPGMPGMTGPDLAARQKKSILDAIQGDLTSLQGKLGNSEKARLDLHLQALRDVEMRATAAAPTMTGGPGASACNTGGFNKGGFVVPAMDNSYPKTYEKEANFVTMGDLQLDLIKLALGCNMTRVITLMWSHAVSPTKVPGLGTTIGNHDASHYGVNAQGENARQFTQYRKFFMGKLVSLVNALKATPSPDGNVFDTTVIYVCSDIGDGDLHEHRDVPFLVLGGSKTGLRGGRFLNFTGKGMGGQNESHAKILVSIANAVGVPMQTFNYTGMGPGGLPGLFA
jgi:hypothetical protein